MGTAGNFPDLERTLNLGVGMVAIVDPSVADAAVEHLNKRGVHSWLMVEVRPLDPAARHPGSDWVQGAKGVDGGGVLMTGSYAN